jgi:hypothetical protein
VEYKIEKANEERVSAMYSKDYLLGRYGAVPLLKEFKMLED